MNKKKETLVFFSGYHLPHLGGIERYTDNLGQELIKKGYNVVVVTSNYDNLPNTEDIHGLKVIRIPIYNIFTSRYPIPKKNKEYKELIKELDQYNIKAIIVNTRFHLTSLVGAKYGKKHNIPVYQVEHGSGHLTVDNKVLDFFGLIYEHLLTSYIKRYFNYSYGVSKEACNWLNHFKIKSSGVWYNSIKEFGNDIKKTKNGKCINITYAGRILKQKGLERLIDSFIKLNDKNTKLYIAGDGNLLPKLKSDYKKYKNIQFLGKLNFDELTKLYAKTDIFVYAPIWPEGLPTGILEAGYMKTSVIASPLGGTKEIIEDKKNGIMINNNDEMYEALKLLTKDSKLRSKYADELYKTVNNKFLWSKTSDIVIKDINKKAN